MSDQIRISPEEMRNNATAYDTQAEVVNEVVGKMDSYMESIRTQFQGRAIEAFCSRYAELRPGFVKAEELIGEISRTLRGVADAVESLDNDAANKILNG